MNYVACFIDFEECAIIQYKMKGLAKINEQIDQIHNSLINATNTGELTSQLIELIKQKKKLAKEDKIKHLQAELAQLTNF